MTHGKPKLKTISVTEYRQGSIDGFWCAIVGCQNSPSERCNIPPSCGVHYCEDHYPGHFHVVSPVQRYVDN